MRSMGIKRRMGWLLVILMIVQIVGPLPRADAENKAARGLAGGVIGFLVGATVMTALGAGGLVVVAGSVAGIYIGKWLGKNLNSFFKSRKKELSKAGTAVVNTAGAAAKRLQEQEAKAAEFIKALTGQDDPKGSAQPASRAEIDEAMAKYQEAYRAYSAAVQRGDSAEAKKSGDRYRACQDRYQSLLKGQGR